MAFSTAARRWTVNLRSPTVRVAWLPKLLAMIGSPSGRGAAIGIVDRRGGLTRLRPPKQFRRDRRERSGERSLRSRRNGVTQMCRRLLLVRRRGRRRGRGRLAFLLAAEVLEV